MVKFMQALFGLGGETEESSSSATHETGISTNQSYIKASELRLDSLHRLYSRFKSTPYGPRLKAVLEKTENIHHFLVARGRGQELEVFHIQKTDNFLNTFTAIVNYHQAAAGGKNVPGPKAKGDSLFKRFSRRQEKNKPKVEMVKTEDSRGRSVLENEGSHVPDLRIPEVAINSFASIVYEPDPGEGQAAKEIGFTSSEEEKAAFQEFVSAHLGAEPVTYMGNALVKIQNSNGQTPTGLVPIIYWEGFLYALNLNDFRLFPVKMYRSR